MELKETNFGKIVTELNNFTELINPKAIAKLENMSKTEIDEVIAEGSFKSEVAKWYQFLIEGMRVISTEE